MELGSIKFGLGVAAVFMTALGLLFALYCKVGEMSGRKARKKVGASGLTKKP